MFDVEPDADLGVHLCDHRWSSLYEQEYFFLSKEDKSNKEKSHF